MFESYIGPEKFQEGIRRFLHKYEWGTQRQRSFLEALGGSDQAVGRAFSTFLDQGGRPSGDRSAPVRRRKRENCNSLSSAFFLAAHRAQPARAGTSRSASGIPQAQKSSDLAF